MANTHLLAETTADVILDGLRMARETADMLGVDVRAVAVEEGLDREIAAAAPGVEVFPLKRIVQPPVGPMNLKVPRTGPLFVVR